MEAVITIDVLRRSGADVTVGSVEKQLRVDACHGVKIVADALVSDCRDTVFDLIALPVCVGSCCSSFSVSYIFVVVFLCCIRSSFLDGFSLDADE